MGEICTNPKRRYNMVSGVFCARNTQIPTICARNVNTIRSSLQIRIRYVPIFGVQLRIIPFRFLGMYFSSYRDCIEAFEAHKRETRTGWRCVSSNPLFGMLKSLLFIWHLLCECYLLIHLYIHVLMHVHSSYSIIDIHTFIYSYIHNLIFIYLYVCIFK